MKTNHRFILLSALLLVAGGLRAQFPESLRVTEVVLKNGLKVWLNEDHT